MSQEIYNMVQECTNKYFIEDSNEKEVEIRIRIPRKFRSLRLLKLSDLKTTENELEEYQED